MADVLRWLDMDRRSILDGFLLGSPDTPRTLWARRFVGLPYRWALVGDPVKEGRGAGVICVLRTGDSGLGSDILGRCFCWGLGARAPGPTEALNLGKAGVGGV